MCGSPCSGLGLPCPLPPQLVKDIEDALGYLDTHFTFDKAQMDKVGRPALAGTCSERGPPAGKAPGAGRRTTRCGRAACPAQPLLPSRLAA